jgi:predicted SAM-dependent methyltransferase
MLNHLCDYKRINFGCGRSPTPGWINFDNSQSINIASSPIKFFILRKFGFLNLQQIENIKWLKENKIFYADATKKLPFSKNEINYIYSSHMLEHLSKKSARKFLKECLRVLKPNGVLRLVLPDLRQLVESYIQNGDADIFLEKSYLGTPPAETLQDKLKVIFQGYRHHQWMYDAKSLSKMLLENGFKKVVEQKAGVTFIDNYGELDLYERSEESFIIEAFK